MTYLAEVVQAQRLGQKAKAKLIGVKRSDTLWVGCPSAIVNLPYSKVWHLEQLILLELGSNGEVNEAIPAIEVLFEALRQSSFLNKHKADLQLLGKSLQYQSAELLEREEDLKKREVDLNHREQLQAIQQQELESLKEKASAKLKVIEIQHAALAQAWDHVNYKEQQLKGRIV